MISTSVAIAFAEQPHPFVASTGQSVGFQRRHNQHRMQPPRLDRVVSYNSVTIREGQGNSITAIVVPAGKGAVEPPL